MMRQTLELLSNRIEEERRVIVEIMGEGAAKDYAHYQNAVGRAQGLLIAQRIIADLVKTTEDEDD